MILADMVAPNETCQLAFATLVARLPNASQDQCKVTLKHALDFTHTVFRACT